MTSGISEAGETAPLTEPDAPQGGSPAPSDEAFAKLLLHALSEMASRSKRRQADVGAALCGAGLPAEPARVRPALRILQTLGCVEKLVPLSDGGLLLSVPPGAIDRLGERAHWLPLAEHR